MIPHKFAIITRYFLFLPLFLICILPACGQVSEQDSVSIGVAIGPSIHQDTLSQTLHQNITYMEDSLLKRKGDYLDKYLDKYHSDSCDIITYSSADLKEKFEGVKDIGDINGNHVRDSVFVVPPFNNCEEGDSYSFFDSSLPRLYTDSYCCHPDNLFSIGDIDEDGMLEICIFYSSCVSRFKTLIAYSLKYGEWKEVGTCTFDISMMSPSKEKRVRKIAKGTFEMLEMEIDELDKNAKVRKEWKRFSF